jgi:tellurite resistance protein
MKSSPYLLEIANLARFTPEGQPTILEHAATAYGSRPDEGATLPTGFDLHASRLFECFVEAGFLVAVADGVFDADERRAFEEIVRATCAGAVAGTDVTGLVSDLADQLEEDGQATRIERLAASVRSPAQAREVLRVAALMALANGELHPAEEQVLRTLAEALHVPVAELTATVDAARNAVAALGS